MFGWQSRAAVSASQSRRSSRTSCLGACSDGLERDESAQLAVLRLVHHAEAAPPDLPDELEAADDRPA